MRRISKARHPRKRTSSKTPWVAMGALVASTAFGGRAYAVADPRLVGLRFLVPSESIVGAWRDNTLRLAQGGLRHSKANPPARQEPPVRRFDIAAGPLDAVLASFSQATGLRLRVGDEIIGNVAVAGRHRPVHRRTGPGAVAGGHRRHLPLHRRRRGAAGTGWHVGVCRGQRPAPIGCVTEIHRAAPRRAADDQRHQQRGDGAAGRDDAARGAAQRARHHVPGGRRRSAGRRPAHDPRLQRAHRHLRRRRARLRRLHARQLQPRAGRGRQGPLLRNHGAGLHGGVNQSSEQDARPDGVVRRHDWRRQRRVRPLDHRHQPADRPPARRRGAPQRDVDRCGRARARSRRGHALGRRAVCGRGPGHADAREPQLLSSRSGQPARVRASLGCRSTPIPTWPSTRTAGRRSTRATSTA